MTDYEDGRFGVDLALSAVGDGVRDVSAARSSDLGTVRGVDAVVQSLTLRMLVRHGELARLGWPDYGSRLHELIGEPDVARTRLRLAQYAREAVAADPRTDEVLEVTVAIVRLEATITLQVRVVGETTPVALYVAVPLEAS